MTDWYLCFKSNIQTVVCLGPFNETIDVDYKLSNEDAALIGVCKYMPKFMAKRRIINLYNNYSGKVFKYEFVFNINQ
jgi:hypothetical protein